MFLVDGSGSVGLIDFATQLEFIKQITSALTLGPDAARIGMMQYSGSRSCVGVETFNEAIGIYEVVIDNTNLKNQEYYTNTNQTFDFADGTVTASYGTATAKNLDDTLYTADDEAENANNVEGTVAARGLKYNHKDVLIIYQKKFDFNFDLKKLFSL